MKDTWRRRARRCRHRRGKRSPFVWLADLAPEQVTAPTHGHFVFVLDSLVDEHDGCYGVEAAGPPGVSRTVQFAEGESDEGLDVAAPVAQRVSKGAATGYTESTDQGEKRGTN